MCICMTLISIFVDATFTIQFSYPYNCFIKKCGHGANLNRNQERKQYSYIEVRMIYVRHV